MNMLFLDPVNHSKFYDYFSELYKLYDEVKNVVLLAEYENKEKKFIITSVNELRNSLDHIMRSVVDPAKMERHFDKAKGHIYRAGYDAYEIIAITKLNDILKVREQFSYEAIIEAYPEYHTKIVPATELAKKTLVNARSHKEIDKKVDRASKEKEFFDEFESVVKTLIEIVDDLNLHLSGIKEAQDNLKKRKRNKTIMYIIGIFISILLLIFEYNVLAKNRQSTNDKTKSELNQSDTLK